MYWFLEQWLTCSKVSYHAHRLQQAGEWSVHVAEGTHTCFPLSSLPITTQWLEEALNAALETISHHHNQNIKWFLSEEWRLRQKSCAQFAIWEVLERARTTSKETRSTAVMVETSHSNHPPGVFHFFYLKETWFAQFQVYNMDCILGSYVLM